MSGFDDYPKALNGWQSKLYGLGYPGPYEVGAMLRRLEKAVAIQDCRYELTLGALLSGPWMVRYQWFECFEHEYEADTPEEAVANLMIAHPELWQVKP